VRISLILNYKSTVESFPISYRMLPSRIEKYVSSVYLPTKNTLQLPRHAYRQAYGHEGVQLMIISINVISAIYELFLKGAGV
jgi:hypothetical protein